MYVSCLFVIVYFCKVNVELNIDRLRYLLSLYWMEEADLLDAINEGLKRKYTYGQVFSSEVDLKILKKIDSLLFNKGLAFYIDPSPIEVTERMSVFFRKKSFNEDLNFTSKKVVNEFETLKNYLASLDSLSNVTTTISIPHYTVRHAPRTAAQKVRSLIYPEKRYDTPRDFLKALINRLADVGVLVFEYLESPKKKEKANIDGFFLKPNFIVLKRHSSSYKREIFTLLHELGHCVLNEEEVESVDIQSMDYNSMTRIERWCNDFAYYFLIGDYAERVNEIEKADGTNDYQFPLIDDLSKKCHISKRAIFTRLFYNGKITRHDYDNVIRDLDEQFAKGRTLQRVSCEIEKDGFKRKIAVPRPIYSPLFLSTLSVALHDGIVRPAELYQMKIPARVVEGLGRWL